MTHGALAEQSPWRRSIYVILIATSLGAMVGRTLAVRAQSGESPMLSANDRSRWCTIRSLVEDRTYAIDRVIEHRHPETHRTFWRTIDMVRHRGPDGVEHYYSSKPPLLATMLAGEYWVIKRVTGASIVKNPFYVIRMMLILTNGALLVVYFGVLAHLLEQYGRSDWGRVLVMAAATWGTFLTTYAVTLNNHLPAAVAVIVTVAGALSVYRQDRWPAGAGLITGLAAGMAVANELPALSLLAVVGASFVWRKQWHAVVAFSVGAALVGAAFFGTNYLAHQSWRPPYAHRSDGPLIASVSRAELAYFENKTVSSNLISAVASPNVKLSDNTEVIPRGSGGWVIWDPDSQTRLAVADNGQALEIRTWDDWYDYDGSYWKTARSGVDRGEPSRTSYAVHLVIGHHGILSLTPIWILSLVGGTMVALDRHHPLRQLALGTAGLTVVCLAFYVARPLIDRNYGGVTSGLRWMFWFIPLWLMCLIPAADRLSTGRIRRAIAITLLIVSTASAAYSSMNPWVHPWLYEYWQTLGWVG